MWWVQTFPNYPHSRWPGSWWGHMGPGLMGWGIGGNGWFGVIFMVAWWAVVIIAIVALIRWLFAANRMRGACSPPSESALDIAKKRYARGEIDKEQFQALKRDLED
jgi:putative membrane protein